MDREDGMRVAGSIITAVIALAVVSLPKMVFATTIDGITLTSQNIFADDRGINDVGVASGFRFQYGGDIAGGSAGDSIEGIFTPTGGTPAPVSSVNPCGPLSTDANFCATSTDFSASLLNGSWSAEISTGTSSATFALPSVSGIPTTPVPFPSSVTITNSANGIQPTISWTLPSGFVPDAFRINIFDRSTPPLANGTDNIITTIDLPTTATSYTLPAVFADTGLSLTVGDKYSISFQVIETRDGTSNISSNANILTRSTSYFDFTPELGSTTPANIALPMVDGSTGIYYFDVGSVGPSSITFIDPAIAVGYIYETGAGDPNFASVLLPDVGGGIFELLYGLTSVTLDAGIQYFFPAGGVSEFTVTGIDPSADLDPANTSAFVTGLTFVDDGSFTGTMTPITENVSSVPEPASFVLLASNIVGFGLMRWRRKRPCRARLA
jgi:hypothetical protein